MDCNLIHETRIENFARYIFQTLLETFENSECLFSSVFIFSLQFFSFFFYSKLFVKLFKTFSPFSFSSNSCLFKLTHSQ